MQRYIGLLLFKHRRLLVRRESSSAQSEQRLATLILCTSPGLPLVLLFHFAEFLLNIVLSYLNPFLWATRCRVGPADLSIRRRIWMPGDLFARELCLFRWGVLTGYSPIRFWQSSVWIFFRSSRKHFLPSSNCGRRSVTASPRLIRGWRDYAQDQRPDVVVGDKQRP